MRMGRILVGTNRYWEHDELNEDEVICIYAPQIHHLGLFRTERSLLSHELENAQPGDDDPA
jgi:hypothetical protein